MVVFAVHNVLNDPPFSGMDLIACRNLMIFLENQAQKNVLGRFHFALRSGGAAVYRRRRDGVRRQRVVRSRGQAVPRLPAHRPESPGAVELRQPRRLRESHGAGLRLVALTGHGQVEDAQDFDHHLLKPTSVAEIRKVLGG